MVLDASAFLALIQGEPGAERVEAVLMRAAMSSVNLTEVVTKLVAKGTTVDEVHAIVDGLKPIVHPFEHELAVEAGFLYGTTKAFGLSLGDRACLALARQLQATVLTTDRRGRVWRWASRSM